MKLFYLKVGRYGDTSSSNVHLWEDKFETMYTSFSIVQKYKEFYKKAYHANKGTGIKETTDLKKEEENTKKKLMLNRNERKISISVTQSVSKT